MGKPRLPRNRPAIFAGICFAVLLVQTKVLIAANPSQSEIKVTLFGQPCLLQGPADEATLKLIHSVSPEQLYPVQMALSASTQDQTRKALEKTKATQKLPSSLETYREKLMRRLQAQVAFFDALSSFQKMGKSSVLTEVARKQIQSQKRLKDFEELLKKLESKPKNTDRAGLIDQLYGQFSESIEPDPEEEFHRGLKRMNIRYTCSFEEGGGSSDEEGADE